MSSLNKNPEMVIIENQFFDNRKNSIKVLAVAKEQERKKIKQGYKWIRVDSHTIKLKPIKDEK